MEIRVHIAVLVVASEPQRADTTAADIIAQKAAQTGHSVVARATVGDTEAAIRSKLEVWIADPEIDVVIVAAAPETQHASAALKPLVAEPVPGFTDLFRWLAFQEIGASAMTAAAEAAKCGEGTTATFVFELPGVAAAATAAMDKLILPQLDARSTGKTLVAQMPRLAALVAPAAPVSAPAEELAAEPTEAVPTAVTGERTEAGPGLLPRLPAANIVRKETPPPAVKPPPDERTRVISTSQLERKLQQSNQHDVATKPRIDLARLLPRMPPGADADFDDAETSDITGVLSPQPFAPPTRPTPTPKKSTVSVPAIIKREDSGRARQAPRRDEDGRVILPGKDPGSGAIGRAKISQPPATEPAPTVRAPRPAIHDAKTPPIEPVLPPALRPKFEDAKTKTLPPKFVDAKTPVPSKPSFEAKTPVPQLPKFVDAKTPPVAPPAPKPVEPIGRPKATPAAATPAVPKPRPKWIAAETLETFEPLDDEPATIAPANRRAPERPEVSSPSIPIDDAEVEEISKAALLPPAPPAVPPAPPPRRTVATPTTQAFAPPPPPVVVAPSPAPPAPAPPAPVPAPPAPPAPPPRPREPTPLPVFAKRADPLDDALPLGEAEFPSLKPRTGRRVAIFLLLAVLAAAGGIAFVRFVIQKPQPKAPDIARAPAPADAAVAAPKSIDAATQIAQAPVPADAAVVPEVPPAPPTPPAPPSHAHSGGSSTRGHHHDHDHGGHGHTVAEVPPPPAPLKAPPETPKPPEPPVEDGCDEISCVEIDYAKTCCERYKPHDAGFRPSADSLDKTAVLTGMGTVKPRVIACGEANKAVTGVVTIAVVVSGPGAVTSATVVDAPSPKLGECVTAAVKRAHFAKTVNGGSFDYPFKF